MLRFLKIEHLAVIDAVEVEFDAGFNILTGETGAGKSILAPAAAAFGTLRSLSDEIARVRRAAADRDTRQELVSFQLSEIERATIKAAAPGELAEDVQLASARQVLASAERVERLCAESYVTLYESDGAVLAGLGGVWKRVGELSALDPRFQP